MSNLPEAIKPTEVDQQGLIGAKEVDHLSPEASAFEQELFADGVYIFDPAKDEAEAHEDVTRHHEWYKQNPYWDEQRTRESLSRDVFQARWELAWKQHFSGRVPKNWDMWHGPMDAFERAGEKGIQLSPVLIDAGISHDHHLVATRAGTTQRLSIHQLGIAFGRDLPPWNLEEVVAAQRDKGMSAKDVEKARQIGEEIRRKMESGTIMLGAGRTELPETHRTPKHNGRLLKLLSR